MIESVRVHKGTFSWRTCRCSLAISDSSGKELYRTTAAKRKTPFIFPNVGAYKVKFSGRVMRAGHWRTFAVADALRVL